MPMGKGYKRGKSGSAYKATKTKGGGTGRSIKRPDAGRINKVKRGK